MHRVILSLASILVCAATVEAAGLAMPAAGAELSRPAFRKAGLEAGYAMSFPVADKAAPYGITGFDAGVGYEYAKVNDKAWNQGFARVVKGLPLGIDLGLMAGKHLGGGETVVGGEVKYALVEGGAVAPAVGFRGAYTQLLQSDFMTLKTASLQADISKGLPFITPYAGGGVTEVWAKPGSGVTVDGTKENGGLPQVWLGVKISPLPFLSVTLHGQYAFDKAPLLAALQLSAGL